MKATFKVKDGLLFEVEGKEQRDIFENLASLQEVFGETQCGLCGEKNIRFVVRTVEDNNFFEYQCTKCGGKLALSQNKKGGTLYPVRKLKNGLPAKVDDEGPFDWKTKGWHKWEKDKAPAKSPDNSKKK